MILLPKRVQRSIYFHEPLQEVGPVFSLCFLKTKHFADIAPLMSLVLFMVCKFL